jgi:probable HAF family extracellular repeat protein
MKLGGLVFALALLTTCAGAQPKKLPHQRYKLIDVGTFGGPNSIYNVFSRIATDDGVVVGAANTADPDLNAPSACFDEQTCLVQHAGRWRRGVLRDLGVLTPGYSSYTNAINRRGLIVGQSQDESIDPLTGDPSVYKAVVWDHGKIRGLGTFGGGNSIAIAVTDQNFVMGAAENGVLDTEGLSGFDGASQIRAFGWNGKAIFDLGTLGGSDAFPSDMNNLGQVVGVSTTTTSGPVGAAPRAPFLWLRGRMRNIGSLGGNYGGAAAINNRGQVTGSSNLAGDSVTHPLLWGNGHMRDLGTLGGPSAVGEWLNDRGEVVGISDTAQSASLHDFVWRQNKLVDLGVVAGDNASNTFGINNSGEIVGQSWFFDGHDTVASHAFVWPGYGPLLDLNRLIDGSAEINLGEADFITDSGWIVARGFVPNGELHTAILIPVCHQNGAESNATSSLVEEPMVSSRVFAPLTPQMRTVLKARIQQNLQRTGHTQSGQPLAQPWGYAKRK